jgi:hypothetical protein
MLRDKATQAAPAGRLTNSPTVKRQGHAEKFVLIPYGDCHVSGILETKKMSGGANLRFFGDDFAVLPNINGRTVHACGLARGSGSTAERAPDGIGEFFARLHSLWPFSFHDLFNNFALSPELSYTRAKRR